MVFAEGSSTLREKALSFKILFAVLWKKKREKRLKNRFLIWGSKVQNVTVGKALFDGANTRVFMDE